MARFSMLLATLLVAALVAVGCGDDDSSGDDVSSTEATAPPTQTESSGSPDDSTTGGASGEATPEAEVEDPTQAPADPDDGAGSDEPSAPDDGAGSDEPAAPAEDNGSVTIGDQAADVSADAFLICETVNPAFDEAINIVVQLPFEPNELRVAGDLPADVEVELGADAFDRVLAGDVEVSRTDRTVSGSASADGQTVEFTFTC